MKLAVALLLLLVPLAVGCGDDEGGDVPGVSSVTVGFDEPLRPGPVTWEVTLTAAEDLELSFADAQRADVTLSRGGEVVYRWGRSQMFAQELGEASLQAGDQLSYELEDVLEVDPGQYDLRAWITATGQELSADEQVTVEPR